MPDNPVSSSDDHGSYMDLIQRFPLRPLRSDREHERAMAIIDELIDADLDGGAGDYLDTLVVLVNKYEDEHHGIGKDMTPREAVKALMQFNRLTQADLGKIIGSESAVSMFLSGSRGLSKAQIKKLAERFKIDAAVFIE